MVSGNWCLISKKEGELRVVNTDGQQQATILRDELPGFVFESNRNTRHTFTAETCLPSEISAGWSSAASGAAGGKPGNMANKVERLKLQVSAMLQTAAAGCG